jgi:hypothetical protein
MMSRRRFEAYKATLARRLGEDVADPPGREHRIVERGSDRGRPCGPLVLGATNMLDHHAAAAAGCAPAAGHAPSFCAVLRPLPELPQGAADRHEREARASARSQIKNTLMRNEMYWSLILIVSTCSGLPPSDLLQIYTGPEGLDALSEAASKLLPLAGRSVEQEVSGELPA